MDDTVTIAAGGATGGAFLLAVGAQLWKMFSATNAAHAANNLGTEYNRHMYERLSQLEKREQALNAKILAQTELIGSLRHEISDLKADLQTAQEKYQEAKRLLEVMTGHYERAKAELADFERKFTDPLRPTGTLPVRPEAKPWNPGRPK